MNFFSDTIALFSSFNEIMDGAIKTDEQKIGAVDLWASRGDLFELTRKFVLEPVIVVSDTLKGTEQIEDMIRMNINYYVSLYTTAFTNIVNIYGYTPALAFDVLSTSNTTMRDLAGRAFKGGLISLESADVPTLDLEDESTLFDLETKFTDHKPKDAMKTDIFFKQFVISVTTKAEGKKKHDKNAKERTFEVPMVVKASVVYAPMADITNLFSKDSVDNQIFARWHAANAGVISWKQFFIPNDLVKEYKKALLRDRSDLYKLLNNRLEASAGKVITSGFEGFGKYAASYIIHKDEVLPLERLINSKLKTAESGATLLEAGKGLFFYVVDDAHELVDIYTTLPSKTTVDMKSLKKSDKKDELVDVIKTMLTNKSTTII